MTDAGRPVAVVSGAGTGIGAASARCLADDGFDVVLAGRRLARLEATAAELRSAHPLASITCRPTDVTDPDAVSSLARFVAEEFGTVHALVNNAGAPATAHTSDLHDLVRAWTQTYLSNTISAVLMTTAFEPLLARPGGRVVLVGSQVARTGSATPAYVAAKAALEGYLLATAARLGPDGITVNLIAPGYTPDTELTAGRISPERHSRLLSSIMLGRPAESHEIAAAVAFVAAPQASYVTGQVLVVDGGYAPWRGTA